MSGCAVWSPLVVVVGSLLIGGGVGAAVGLFCLRGRRGS